MDMLMDPYVVVIDPPGEVFPIAIIYLEFEDETRLLADLATPVYDSLKS